MGLLLFLLMNIYKGLDQLKDWYWRIWLIIWYEDKHAVDKAF